MKKIIVTTAVIVFSMAIIAYAAPDSNSIVKDDIEYYMQTDKSVYNLGEEEEEEGGATSEQDELVLIELRTDKGELDYELNNVCVLEDDTEDSYYCFGSFDASYPCSNAVDEDWSTYTLPADPGATSYIYEYYIIPIWNINGRFYNKI